MINKPVNEDTPQPPPPNLQFPSSHTLLIFVKSEQGNNLREIQGLTEAHMMSSGRAEIDSRSQKCWDQGSESHATGLSRVPPTPSMMH